MSYIISLGAAAGFYFTISYLIYLANIKYVFIGFVGKTYPLLLIIIKIIIF